MSSEFEITFGKVNYSFCGISCHDSSDPYLFMTMVIVLRSYPDYKYNEFGTLKDNISISIKSSLMVIAD